MKVGVDTEEKGRSGSFLQVDQSNIFTNNSTSVSQIETFYSCPYKHFARYGLRLKVKEKCE